MLEKPSLLPLSPSTPSMACDILAGTWSSVRLVFLTFHMFIHDPCSHQHEGRVCDWICGTWCYRHFDCCPHSDKINGWPGLLGVCLAYINIINNTTDSLVLFASISTQTLTRQGCSLLCSSCLSNSLYFPYLPELAPFDCEKSHSLSSHREVPLVWGSSA